ncbi:hypothetical protein ACDY96_14885 [Rhizobium mongolense]|uniref:hypothetical protein n=1 Tax=Rhizobium TaxID=379 RepID=UPI0024B124BD|nr:hypothetical protein [Rhizobium sp. CC1099]WFU89741.1 hypothetical protein QA644_04205 [Rhizobium sp. CC1099]
MSWLTASTAIVCAERKGNLNIRAETDLRAEDMGHSSFACAAKAAATICGTAPRLTGKRCGFVSSAFIKSFMKGARKTILITRPHPCRLRPAMSRGPALSYEPIGLWAGLYATPDDACVVLALADLKAQGLRSFFIPS